MKLKLCSYLLLLMLCVMLSGCAASFPIHESGIKASVGSVKIRYVDNWEQYREYRGQGSVIGAKIEGRF